MTAQNSILQYGERRVHYVIDRRARNTLAISVTPRGAIEVVAPLRSTDAEIEAIVRRRMRWVLRHQKAFARFGDQQTQRHYLSGEEHRYLGRRYRLKVIQGGVAEVKARGGQLVVTTHRPSRSDETALLLEAWYRLRASEVFVRRLEAVLPLFKRPGEVRPTSLQIRKAAARWGSMTPAGKMILNLELIQKPTRCIDYVIAHELCHRLEPNHGRSFWSLLTRVMPDWQLRKERLEARP